MRVLLIRHAIAMAREDFARTGRPDGERPLTRDGREKMAHAALGLVRIVPDVSPLASSPLVRAVETADILARVWVGSPRTSIDALAPESPHSRFLEWLRDLQDTQVVAAVGHEPHLSGLASWLMTRRSAPLMEFKKGGAALLSFDDRIAAGQARLRWMLAPAQLRQLGE